MKFIILFRIKENNVRELILVIETIIWNKFN